MKWTNKIKTAIIGVTTALLTSCGFKANEAQVVERSSHDHAFNVGSDTENGAKRNHDGEKCYGFIGIPEKDAIQASRNHQEDKIDSLMRQEWQQKLDAAGIPITKEGKNNTDSLLVSVEEQDGKLQNPVYGLNPSVMAPKKELVDGYVIERAGNEQKINKFNASSFGMEDVKDVYERVSSKKKVVENEKVEKSLRKGDKVSGYVVEEDGKSPVGEYTTKTFEKSKYTLNYKRNMHYDFARAEKD